MARLSTSSPQWWQVWGLHKEAPRRRPTATLMVLSSIRRPSAETGRTFSQAPDSLAAAASRRARDLGSVALSNRDSAKADTFRVSQLFCWCWASPSGGTKSPPPHHMTLASSTLRSEEPRRRGGMMWWTRSEEAAAEARKAEGASCTALRIPSPPIFTGRVACAHAGSSSVKSIFVIRPMIAWRSLSYSCNTGERKQGEVLRL